MANNLPSLEQETMTKVITSVHDKVSLLTSTWKRFFDESSYTDYMMSLPACIGLFLDEVLCVTLQFYKGRTNDISLMQFEVDALLQMLQPRVSQSESAEGTPPAYTQPQPDCRLMMLHHMSESLRRQIIYRTKQLEEYLQDQSQLLSEVECLQPTYEPVCTVAQTEPLTNEQVMAILGEYIEGLQQENMARHERIAQLQSDVRDLAQQLQWVPPKEEQRLLMHDHYLPVNEQTVRDLENLYNVLFNLLKGKLQQQQQQQPHQSQQSDSSQQAPVTVAPCALEPSVNSSPAPPPPSPEGELMVAAGVSTATLPEQPEQQKPPPSPPAAGVLEQYVLSYQQLMAEPNNINASRERIIEGMFRGLQGNIKVWSDRCLLVKQQQQQQPFFSTADSELPPASMDEETMVALVKRLNQLKAYYFENESLFQLLYQWANQWNKLLKLSPAPKPAVSRTKKKKKPVACAAENDCRLRQAKEKLKVIEMQLQVKCLHFMQRYRREFSVFGIPAMELLKIVSDKREELVLPPNLRPALSTGQNFPVPLASMPELLPAPRRSKQPHRSAGELAAPIIPPAVPEEGSSNDLTEKQIFEKLDEMFSGLGNSSSTDGEADEKRDTELLDELYASARMGRIAAENVARVTANLGKSSLYAAIHDEAGAFSTAIASSDTSAGRMAAPTPTVIKQTTLEARELTPHNAANIVTTETIGGPTAATVASAPTASLDCAGSSKVPRKAKQPAKRTLIY